MYLNADGSRDMQIRDFSAGQYKLYQSLCTVVQSSLTVHVC